MIRIRTHLAALTGACVVVGLSACGDDEKEAEPAATTAPTVATTTPAATATEAAEATGGDGEMTKPGTQLSFGDTAHVDYQPLSAADDKTTFPIDVTVLELEKGSLDDFKNIDLDEKQKSSTPYYVKVKISNPGDDIKLDGDPELGVEGIDDRGQEQGDITFFGDFERCDDVEAPNPFKQGEEYETCLTYLVPGGGSIEEVHWTGGKDEYLFKPVVWK